MSKTIAWLIRHAESETPGVWGGPNVSLSEKGKEQAKFVATKIISRPSLIVVSPFKRSQDTASFIIKKWPDVPVKIWQIQELTYFDPYKFQKKTPLEKEKMIENYWQILDPYFSDGKNAESFASFIDRLQRFNKCLQTCNGFIVVVGHAQFFKAYEIGMQQGFAATKEWMRIFRKEVISKPIENCEILKFLVHKGKDDGGQ